MIIYSVTVKVDLDIHDEWIAWLRDEHIQDVLNTGKFVKHKLHRILQEDESDGITYNIHYYANSIGDYFEYRDTFATEMQQKGLIRFKDKFVAFRTLLKEVD